MQRPLNDCESRGIGCTRNRAQVWYCVDCACEFCDPCWQHFLAHRGGKKGRDGSHEKVEYHVYAKLKSILDPQYDEDKMEELHEDDLATTWFGTICSLIRALINTDLFSGIKRDDDPEHYDSLHRRGDQSDRQQFFDYDVYSALLCNPLKNGKEKYPQLVSFIGQTSNGSINRIVNSSRLTAHQMLGKVH